ncbi:hypothetical protein L6R50_27950, partial [Myxococcota bacterium]|nr:hypothetical protein [Myxococcota bacterium]
GWLLQLVASTWLPLGAATARASVARERTFTATLRGIETLFSTHHYRAWAFEQVQLRWQALSEPHRASLRPALEGAGILPSLLADGILHNALFDGFTPPFVVDGVADARIRHQKAKADRPG